MVPRSRPRWPKCNDWIERRAIHRRTPALRLETHMDHLDVRKRDLLLDQLKRRSATDASPKPRIVARAGATGAVPLSLEQRRLWFLDQMAGKSAAYNIAEVLQLKGRLDVDALRHALDGIVRRHEALRTTFDLEAGQPCQVVGEAMTMALEESDICDVSDNDKTAAMLACVDRDLGEPFDLQNGPLFRARLIRLDPEDHVLSLTMHHIVSDAWSIGVLVSELASLYALATGEATTDLAPLEVQYADYALWQRESERADGARLSRQVDYWKQQLEGAPELLSLPLDGVRPAEHRYRGGRSPVSLGPGLSDRLRSFARDQGFTTYMMLHAAWAFLLSRLSGDDDIVIGVPSVTRNARELEGLVGFFINTLPLRVRLSDSMAVESYLDAIRTCTIDALRHAEVPFDRLVGAVNPSRSPAYNPIFQATLSLDNTPRAAIRMPGLDVSRVIVSRAVSAFDATLALQDDGHDIHGMIEYASDLFDAATVEEWSRHLGIVVEALLHDPSRPLGDIRIVQAGQHDALMALSRGGRAAITRPVDETIVSIFERQVRDTPDATALVDGQGTLSYADLNRRANRIARYLRERGVVRETLVAICMERGIGLMTAILGVLKAGGAYLPLDPGYPAERLQYMLQDSEAPFLLSDSSLEADLPASASRVILLDLERERTAAYATDDLDLRNDIGANSLAYVIYTSGTSGQPKGVMLEHGGVCNLASLLRESLDVGAGSQVVQFASFSFDASVWEWSMALLNGACLHLPAREELMPGAPLLDTLRDRHITHATLPPTALHVSGTADLPSLRTLVVAGEACPRELVERWAPGRLFVNAYGPTEATVCATMYRCVAGGKGNVPIGKPLANTTVHILDARGHLVPRGVIGEIHIGGAGVARGYLHRADLTDSRFVSDPFDGAARSRMYATGDLARWLPDGNIEYVGRNDDQLKIRGFRVEPGEIETRLEAIQGIRQAFVAAGADRGAGRELTAYIVPDGSAGEGWQILSNGLRVAQLNGHETRQIFHEIFVAQTYFRHGVMLRKGSCVLDVGANIGLFTLFVKGIDPDARVFAFEPSPPAFDCLSRNVALHDLDVHILRYGLSDTPGMQAFTHYPLMSGNSGFYADALRDSEATRTFLRNRLEHATADVDVVLAGKFASETYDCELRTLSQVLRDHAIEHVDLLKVDVEKSEWDVVRGMDGGDWARVQQVVVEVHDIDGRLIQMLDLLRGHGFVCVSHQEADLKGTDIFQVYGVKPGYAERYAALPIVPCEDVPHAAGRAAGLPEPEAIRARLREYLPDYMVPTSFVVLDELPLTANGKVDRRRLPDAADALSSLQDDGDTWHGIEEDIAHIWREMFPGQRIGRLSSFFELGGHSLLAIQVIGRLRERTGFDLSLQDMFEEPTIEGIAARMAAKSGHDALPITAVDRSGALPLSSAQQRLWFIDRFEQSAHAYNVCGAVRIVGELDEDALCASLDALLHRHEVLRTRFVEEEGVPQQRIESLVAFPLVVASEDDAGIEAIVQDELRVTFDLATGPLIRGRMVRVSPRETILVISLHHIVADGWSLSILFRELGELYALRVADPGAKALPELPLQYADYAAWQRGRLQGDYLQRQLAFWGEHLRGAPALLTLPLDRPRPGVRGYRGANVLFAIDAATTAGLVGLAREQGATLFMVLYTGFAILLSRLSHQADVVIGTPVANRDRIETESLVGFFVNTLALRTRTSDEDGTPLDAATLLATVRQTALEAYRHQEVPFEQVVEHMQPSRDMSHSPLFQASLTLQNVPRSELALAGLSLQPYEVLPETAKTDLSLYLEERDGLIVGGFNYATDLFERETIERWAEYFQVLLSAMVATPSQRIDRLPLMRAPARAAVLQASRGPAVPLAAHTIPALFRAVAQRHASAAALSDGTQCMSYATLDARSNRLARYLREQGVGRETPVAVCLGRGLELVVTMLGIWKAGGAFVPLDPGYPAERLQYMLEDAEPPLVVTTSVLSAGLPTTVARLVELDRIEARLAACADTALPAEDEGDGARLAYVIYTSGSTGRPKGVMVEHGSVCNLWQAQRDSLGVGSGSKVLQFASSSFDASIWEWTMALLGGGCLELATSEALLPGEPLARTLRERGITHLTLPPSALSVLPAGSGESVRVLVVAGEACAPALAQAWLPGRQVINAYGPTEGTVCASMQVCGEEDVESLPIGRPLANTAMYLLDGEGEPVPPGIVGEIWLGGAGVARGYLNQPSLSAERFVADRFAGAVAARMYRTGDLGRWRADGRMAYLGRDDAQVKLRGYRIETGEIEARLREHPAVDEAVVAVRGDDPQLVAYLRGEAADTVAWRDYLAARLPGYMIPQRFVAVASFALTPTGKIDRHRLPDPAGAAADRPHEAPVGEIETLMATLWQGLLGEEGIGRHDNFFERGGHSLLATRLMAQVQDVLSVDLPLRTLFEHPTLAQLSEQVRVAAMAGDGTRMLPLTPRVAGDRGPLSFAQERLWFLERMGLVGTAYGIPVSLRIDGRLDGARLERALDEVVRRHASLRTRFGEADGVPYQVIDPALPRLLPRVDLSGLAVAEGEAALARLQQEAASHRFDLSAGPVYHQQLVTLGEERHALLLTMHHIVFDGWSASIFVREVGAWYEALGEGRVPDLAEPAVRYVDYAAWQRERLQGDYLQRQLAFWGEHLRGAPALLTLPLDRPRPGVRGYRGANVLFAIDAATTAGLVGLAREQGATLFMVLYTGFAILLSRLSHQADVVIGTPVANRDRIETESLVGFFVNTLALRTRTSDEDGTPLDAATLLATVRQTALEAYRHQEVPFEQVVEHMQPSRDMSHSPLFQASLTLQNVPRSELALAGLSLQPYEVLPETAKTDLSLYLEERDGLIVGGFNYATDLFERETIERWAEYFQVLLSAMVATPSQRIDRLPLMRAPARAAVLQASRGPAVPLAAHTIPALFRAVAQRHASAAALSDGTQCMSYATLDARSNRLARYLREQGVGRETPVAVCLGRGLELVVTMLGIWKAGGAFVPLDPGYPAERLQYMLEDAEPPLVVTTSVLSAGLPTTVARLVELDRIEARLAACADTALPAEDEGDGARLAYVIYTSGSTGRPKGVMVEHGSVCNLWQAQRDSLGVGSGSKVLQFASSSFDASIWEWTMALLGGGCLELATSEALLPGEPLARTLRERGITHLTLPPSALSVLPAGSGESVRVLVVAGEACAPALAQAWLPGRQVINAYGPTEGTVCASMQVCGEEDVESLPIGRPLANTAMYLLDGEGEPVPPGIVGEIWLGGAGVARGYLNQPSLSAERFVADRFAGAVAARMYRTGDLGRWRADGRMAYLGRDDAQVKLRGYRIETGEIEARLREHPAVDEAVVAVRGDDPQLVAYLRGEAADTVAWRDYLAARLPGYMIPQRFVAVASFALTPTGKIDRHRLPDPAGAAADRPHEAPVGEIETLMATLWQGLLGEEGIGRHDNFFERGGHSLLATRLMAQVQDVLSVDLPLRTLFEHPTLAQLSEQVRVAAMAGDGTRMLPLTPRVAGDRGPLSFAQERLWFLERMGLVGTAYGIPVSLRIDGRLDGARLERALDEVVRRHASLRTRFGEADGVPYQVIDPALPRLLPRVDLSGLAVAEGEAALARLQQEAASHRFDLSAGPVYHQQLVTLGEERHALLLTMHHIVFDGWSASIFVREVGAWYEALGEGRVPDLAEPAVRYVDYAAWQRERLQGDYLQRQLAFWGEHLRGAPAVTTLPTDRPRPAIASHRGASMSVWLSKELSDELMAFAQRENVTLFMLLLSAFQVLIYRWTGQDDVVVGTPVAGRTHPATEDLVGFFVNMLPLRARIEGGRAFRDALAETREIALQAYANQDLPFERLVAELHPERDLSKHPVFQTKFQLTNFPKSTVSPDGTVFSDMPFATHTTSKFDLSLDMSYEEKGIQYGFEHATDLFDEDTVARFASSYRGLLESVVADPACPVDMLSMDQGSALDRVLAHNPPPTAYPEEGLLHEAFEAHAAASPGALALVYESRQLSYGELNARANQVAAYLRAQGVGPDDLVGVCMERGVEMVVGLLGVLKAGGAYVPLDPGYPPERLAYLLEDAAPRRVLTQSWLRSRLPACEAPVLALDEAWLEEQPCTNVAVPGLGSRHLAYVIYTSGSTGRPKGAMNEHRAVVNRLHWMQQAQGLAASDRVLQKTPYGFDVSVWEFFWPLSQGATLVLARPGGHQDPSYLSGLIRSQGVTTVHFVPSMLRAFLDGVDPAHCMSLRRIVCSGEELPVAVQDDCLARLPWAALYNLYGPTEAAIDVTAWMCRREEGATRVPIGRPIANTRIYILDERGEVVPEGVAGEIHIAGVAVGRGYWRRPELTAERFVTDRFAGAVEARMYRTGDLGRWRKDGVIEYLGRRDDQVKIRGHRIEPGEIEAALLAQPQVRQAAVLAHQDHAGDRRLVAYAGTSMVELRRLHAGAAPVLATVDLVDEWENLYESAYREEDETAGPTFVSWNSSYTGLPIPSEEMDEWLNATVDRILALKPRHVLEIGCGVGLLIERLAPHCESYVASDLSGVAVDSVRRWTARRGEFGHVTVSKRKADDFSGWAPGSMDTIIINSVVQYFPDTRYLLSVLTKAAEALTEGGRIFVGDVRNFDLFEAFHHSVQHAKAGGSFTERQLIDRVRVAMTNEEELLVSPGFFSELGAIVPRLARVETTLRQGVFDNELNRYRYDVVLHVNQQVVPTPCQATTDPADSVDEAMARLANDPLGSRLMHQFSLHLRSALKETLPEYMVPQAIIVLDGLPVSANGKIDRRSLPDPLIAHGMDERTYEPVRGDIESQLAVLWSELLGMDRIGRNDNFFDLGGHSLLAVQLVARIERHMGNQVSLGSIFNLPTIASLAEAIAGMITVPERPSLLKTARQGPIPASFAQRRMWFIDRLQETGAAYHIAVGMRLKGKLQVDALRAALDAIVDRHEALRTVLVESKGMPYQQVMQDATCPLLVFDLAGVSPDRLDEVLALHATEAMEAPFSLSAGPLVRARLVRCARDEHILYIVQHHIVSDGWSMGIFLRELAGLYAAFRGGKSMALTPLPIQYADYALWQQAWLGEDVAMRQLAYWRSHLEGAPAVLELPTDRPRPAKQDYRGDNVMVEIDAGLAAALHRLARSADVTLHMVLVSAFSILLSRLSGQDDVVIGTPVANRDQVEVEDLIGFFVNTLAVRFRPGAARRVDELLNATRQATLRGYAHQDVPFEQVVEALQPRRDASHSPLFQAMFMLRNTPMGDVRLADIECVPEALPGSSAQFDLSLLLHEEDGRIVGAMNYATSLFDRSTVSRWVDSFKRLLAAMAADASAELDSLPLLSAHEHDQVTRLFQGHALPPHDVRLLHEGFEAHAAARPERIALVCGNTEMTYGELNRRANRWAWHLRSMGVSTGDLVALCLERGPELIVGILAILKTGAAYLPLDPGHPDKRIAFMLRDAKPKAVLTRAEASHLLPDDNRVAIIDMDRVSPPERDTNPAPRGCMPGDLAYVIYTSGSTGEPKGVLVEHASVAHLLDATRASFGFSADDVWCLFHSIAFDFSVWEIWGALHHGGQLVIVPRPVAASAVDFHRLVCDSGVTVLNQTPGAFRGFMEADRRSEDKHCLRYVIFGGEALKPAMLREWYARYPEDSPGMVNMYGITETTVHVTCHTLSDSETRSHGSPIGSGIPGMRCYLLDSRRRPVPIGVTGELYIGGPGVARGYLRRPELSAERFLTDPFATEPGARMYRSGDLARFRTDGRLMFLGRADAQVKIRGHRVEMGEVEAVVLAQHEVDQSVVVAREDHAGEWRIVAFVVWSEGHPVDVGRFRARLRESLPDYMVPSIVVPMEQLPVNANGKIDRERLLAMPAVQPVTEQMPASTPVEHLLCGIWVDLLGVEAIGIQDDFFVLGGHSLLVTRMLFKVRDIFQVDIPLGGFLDAPTVGSLAEAIAVRRGNRDEVEDIAAAFIRVGELSDEEVDALLGGTPS
ncbi:non-ribosomal peptide synthase/polyketide synthase [Xanthomonas sp. NCPPB 2632]|uniref:non-ribosomal peptide synthase/polyketide synthase n=1 Tax=Xanthomonas sp. NCPPB 2632 TaxID=3240912 RepID=UPI003519A254